MTFIYSTRVKVRSQISRSQDTDLFSKQGQNLPSGLQNKVPIGGRFSCFICKCPITTLIHILSLKTDHLWEPYFWGVFQMKNVSITHLIQFNPVAIIHYTLLSTAHYQHVLALLLYTVGSGVRYYNVLPIILSNIAKVQKFEVFTSLSLRIHMAL